MSLLDDVKAASVPKRVACTFAGLTLTPEDAADLAAALADTAITGSAISRVLKARGHQVNPDTVQRHRKGDCSCR